MAAEREALVPLGSEQWFERARALTADLPPRPGLAWRIQFDASSADRAPQRWFQVVEQGQVVAWQPGEVENPDLELSWGRADARALYRGELSGTAALAAARVVAPDGTEGPAPPADIWATAELAALPFIPGATIGVQYQFSSGPFGPVSNWMSFENGRCSGNDFGQIEDPDVTVSISFARMVAVRTGQLSILEALEDGGRVEGQVGPLMLLAGLEESPELHAAELACGPAGSVLAKVGELSSSPEWRTALAVIAAVTA